MALAHAHFARRYAHFESTIPNSPPIQPHESDLIDTSLAFDDQNFDSRPGFGLGILTAWEELEIERMGTRIGWKRIPNTIASPVAYFQKIDDDSSAWAKAVATVDASHTRVFSYLWNQHSREHMNRHVEREGPDALHKVVLSPDSHSMLRVNIVSLGLAVSARVFSTLLVWRQEPDKSFTVAFAPLQEDVQSGEGITDENVTRENGRRDAAVAHHKQAKLLRVKLEKKREEEGMANDAQVMLKDEDEVQAFLDSFRKSADEEGPRREAQRAKTKVSTGEPPIPDLSFWTNFPPVASPPFVLP